MDMFQLRLLKEFKAIGDKLNNNFKQLAELKAELTLMDDDATASDEFLRCTGCIHF